MFELKIRDGLLKIGHLKSLHHDSMSVSSKIREPSGGHKLDLYTGPRTNLYV